VWSERGPVVEGPGQLPAAAGGRTEGADVAGGVDAGLGCCVSAVGGSCGLEPPDEGAGSVGDPLGWAEEGGLVADEEASAGEVGSALGVGVGLKVGVGVVVVAGW